MELCNIGTPVPVDMHSMLTVSFLTHAQQAVMWCCICPAAQPLHAVLLH